jgi:hypothetical protein
MSASVSRDEPFSTLPYTSSVEICTNSFSSFERRASSRRTNGAVHVRLDEAARVVEGAVHVRLRREVHDVLAAGEDAGRRRPGSAMSP